MTVYSTGVESYRDTTKWLLALVPLASLVAAASVVVARLVMGKSAAGSWSAWATTFWPALLGWRCAGGHQPHRRQGGQAAECLSRRTSTRSLARKHA